ncbi:MAG: 2-iminoacetate synthase ThiH [Deltaproteobacteria bacterium]|nr:2-iminoacetate synthase ThiH [Deltaproteobacteria bacterium]
MSFWEQARKYDWDETGKTIRFAPAEHVERALTKERLNQDDLAALLSPAAEPYLEEMAQRAHRLTQQRFGKVIQLFTPLYLSNLCTNRCAYCGFNADNPVKRLTLRTEQAAAEGRFLHEQGFRHLLLVSGEAPKVVTLPYLEAILVRLRSLFSSISIELYPMDTRAYRQLILKGVDGLVVFQETYDQRRYMDVHLGGRKRDYRWRLETPERGGDAGFRTLGIGALLGLSDWRVEGFFLALHARYLMKNFWRSRVNISFPRIRPAVSNYQPPYPVSDLHMVQLLTALRLFLPDAGFVLSTREPPPLRDNLIPLGITSMSAGARTAPGGYTQGEEAGAQFDISDHRAPSVVAEVIKQKGYEPVWKDWDVAFLSGANEAIA